jgi:hypothetical protein
MRHGTASCAGRWPTSSARSRSSRRRLRGVREPSSLPGPWPIVWRKLCFPWSQGCSRGPPEFPQSFCSLEFCRWLPEAKRPGVCDLYIAATNSAGGTAIGRVSSLSSSWRRADSRSSDSRATPSDSTRSIARSVRSAVTVQMTSCLSPLCPATDRVSVVVRHVRRTDRAYVDGVAACGVSTVHEAQRRTGSTRSRVAPDLLRPGSRGHGRHC